MRLIRRRGRTRSTGWLPDALVFNGRLSYAFTPSDAWFTSGEAFVRVDNLTDEVRLLQLGLPGPGREFRLGLKATL